MSKELTKTILTNIHNATGRHLYTGKRLDHNAKQNLSNDLLNIERALNWVNKQPEGQEPPKRITPPQKGKAAVIAQMRANLSLALLKCDKAEEEEIRSGLKWLEEN